MNLTGISIPVSPKPVTEVADAYVSSVIIRNVISFDPHEGITVLVSLLNASGQMIGTAPSSISGDAWQNWAATSDPAADVQYATDAILSHLGLVRTN